ncbi:hypothetical protein KUTeg_004505 [Tegillarca granosa]|uniref:G-protein coupled receptors family 1 profile domain-containing protein n=1 Tax=Tegillarca granosa TaxID=220873 RepID=A0ABQ9FQ56_TEGGR|nr:hypothetical protein KUTeg_004505 [Tegillarca granosa]
MAFNVTDNIINNEIDVLPLSSEEYTFIGTVLLIIIIFGTLENGSVLIVFLKNKQLRSTTNCFIISLAVADFAMCVFAIPVSMSSNLANRWLWGDVGCTYEGFMVYFLGLSQMYVLCAISVDRYIVIAKPLYKAKITNRVACVSILSCWIGGFFWAIMPVFGWSSYDKEAQGTSCTIVWQSGELSVKSYNITIFFMCLLFPLSIMIYCYYGVFMTVKNISRNRIWDMNSRIARRNLQIERKMAKSIALMVGTFLFSWVPYAIVSFWAAFGDASMIPAIASALPAILAKSSTIWNPIIYFLTNNQFRSALIRLVPCANLKRYLLGKVEKDDQQDSDTFKTTKLDTTYQTTNKINPSATISTISYNQKQDT